MSKMIIGMDIFSAAWHILSENKFVVSLIMLFMLAIIIDHLTKISGNYLNGSASERRH
jgi:hypothetical protein